MLAPSGGSKWVIEACYVLPRQFTPGISFSQRNLGHGLNVLGMAGEDTETKFGPPRTVYDIGRLGLGGLTNPEPLA